MAERSKARVYGRSPAEIAGSNSAGGMDVCVVLLYSKDKRHSQDKAVQIKYKVFQKKIPPGEWIFVCCRGLCDRLITHPEEFYRLWCVSVCDLET